MSTDERLRAELGAVVHSAGSAQAVAHRLCEACVSLLDVDGAALSLVLGTTDRGTFAASSSLSRRLDELQFTLGEGPCLEAVHSRRPVLVPDLDDPAETRWPAFAGAVLHSGVNAVFALPVSLASSCVGALDLFRHRRGGLDEGALAGGLLAAELAALPLLDLLAQVPEPGPDRPGGQADHDGPGAAAAEDDGWTQLASLERVEVYQATGMIMGALDVDQSEALARLRAHAYTLGRTAAEVAIEVVERRIDVSSPDWRGDAPREGSPR